MKHAFSFCVLLLAAAPLGCGSPRQAQSPALVGPEWELEYLSGPRIAFEALFPDRLPVITFEQESGKVVGNSGCNGYNAPFELDGSSIRFGEPGPSTLMYCGDGETFFRQTMRKVDRWTIDADGKLNLLIGEVPMMRFHRGAAPE